MAPLVTQQSQHFVIDDSSEVSARIRVGLRVGLRVRPFVTHQSQHFAEDSSKVRTSCSY